MDGVGKCGRQLCCTSWLREFTPVSIRMAKNQQLPLNPDEISGVCGRLLCCLSYEDDLYREQNKKMPKLGAEVVTTQGTGRVRHIHPLKETVTVMLENHALVEVAVAELITSKSAAGHGCSTCGGCTVKRRNRPLKKTTRRCAPRRRSAKPCHHPRHVGRRKNRQKARSRKMKRQPPAMHSASGDGGAATAPTGLGSKSL